MRRGEDTPAYAHLSQPLITIISVNYFDYFGIAALVMSACGLHPGRGGTKGLFHTRNRHNDIAWIFVFFATIFCK